nr:hypothetical protein [uncultured Deefgea sp.]
MRFLISFLFFSIALSSFATSAADTVINTDLSVKIHNSVAARHLDTPTFVVLSEDGESLRIWYKEYGKKAVSNYGSNAIAFKKKAVEGVVEVIDKYLAWEAIAASRGDIITKEIGEVSIFTFNTATFSIFSANSENRFLHIKTTAGNNVVFSRSDAIKLKQLLLEFRADQLQSQVIPEGVYQ